MIYLSIWAALGLIGYLWHLFDDGLLKPIFLDLPVSILFGPYMIYLIYKTQGDK